MEPISAARIGPPIALALALLLSAVSCTAADRTSPRADAAADSTAAVDPAADVGPTSTSARSTADVIVSFPDAASVISWRNVDDSVMGGVSASTSTWVEVDGGGALEFSGELSTENNGGFSSTLSRVDSELTGVAAGARALGVRARGDGRTYLLQLRAGPSGIDRWISRFTPPTVIGQSGSMLELPLELFEPVNQFLRPVDPRAPLDPMTVSQIGIYVLDGQVGSFRLVLESISVVR